MTNFQTFPPWYLVLAVAFLAAGFFLGSYKGKHCLKGAILGLYVSGVLYPLVPLAGFLGERPAEEKFWVQTLMFLVLWMVVSFFLTRRYLAEDRDSVWWEVLLLSILVLAFLVTIMLNLLPAELLNAKLLNMPESILKIFTDSTLARWFLIVPILGVILL